MLHEARGVSVVNARTESVVAAMSWRADETKIAYAARLLAAADAVDAPVVEKLAAAARNLIYGNGGGGKDNDRWEKLQTALAEFDAARGDSQGTATKAGHE